MNQGEKLPWLSIHSSDYELNKTDFATLCYKICRK